ncbi:hypothetical protein BH11PLA1_BH11PLA1_08590 [soil metagenome]
MRILGIDPGTRITGFGCVDSPPPGPRLALDSGGATAISRTPASGPITIARDAQIVDAGIIRLDAARPLPDRLVELEREFDALLATLRPDAAAVEALFAHTKHPVTAIIMAHARGILLLALRRRSIPVLELRPAQVKKSLTGFGQAGKGQMQAAIQAEFALAAPPAPADVADALAIALAGARRGIQTLAFSEDTAEDGPAAALRRAARPLPVQRLQRPALPPALARLADA